MTPIDTFYQCECQVDANHMAIDPSVTIDELKSRLIEKHNLAGDLLVFDEDAEEPLEGNATISTVVGKSGAKLHIHRCRKIGICVHYSGQSASRKFAPGTTVAKVKHWAARTFDLSKETIGEHQLQIVGTHERPSPGSHIGCLTAHPECQVEFDLLPDERINGHSCADDVRSPV